MTVSTELRNEDLSNLAELLTAQQAKKVDVVVNAGSLRSVNGKIIVPGAGGEPEVTMEGVTARDLVLDPQGLFDGHVAQRLELGARYMRKIRANSRQELGTPWTHLVDETLNTHFSADPTRKFMVRSFADSSGHGIARALVSSKYQIIDNLDVLTAALAGINESGVNVQVQACDLTERRMSVKMYSPDIAAMAPTLLQGYRTPFENPNRPGAIGHGQAGLRDENGNLPVVFAGFELSNSETGGGAFTLTPRLVVSVCSNGMVIKEDIVKRMHLGADMDHGVIRLAADTQRANLEVVTKTARDTVATFLDAEYVTSKVRQLESDAATQLGDPAAVIEQVSSQLKFSETEQASILDCFIKGGQNTSGGVMHAVTAAAQRIESPDRAGEVEAMGVQAMRTAKKLVMA